MMEVVKVPDKRLKKKAVDVTEPICSDTIDKMWQTMESNRGVGLAANQVGLKGNFFVAKFSFGRVVCVNPKIVRHGKEEVEGPEGCLSILDADGNFIMEPKKRWAVLDVEYSTAQGTRVGRTLKRLDARIFQHEVDHLEGKLCNDNHPTK